MGARERHMAKIGAAANWFRRGREVKEDFLEGMGRPIHRRNPWRKGAPPKEAGDTREVEGVVFLPHTKGSSLQKVIQRADDQVTKALGMPRTKYVEKGGTTLKDLLVKKDPWFKLGGGCGRSTCHICISQGGKGTSCRRESVCYEIESAICAKENEEGGVDRKRKTKYVGETSRSSHERMREHLWLFVHKKDGDPEKGEAKSVLWRHSREEHRGGMGVEDWMSKVTSTHFNALNQQVTEAVKISEGGGGAILLNNKQEFGANLLLEVVVMRGDQVLGRRNGKRRINGAVKDEEACTSVLVQDGGGEDGAVGEEE